MLNLNTLLRTAALLGLVGIGGWWTLFLRGQVLEHELELRARDQQITALESELEQKAKKLAELEVQLFLLKVDHRIARIEVLEQSPVEGRPGRVQTRVRFSELDDAGDPLGSPRELVVEGKFLYLEALVIKFEDGYVEQGDFLRGTSVGFLRRVFGENQSPSEGVALDSAGLRPLPYSGDDLPDPFYLDLWQHFWDYANDPELAAEKGVRAIHGEAPFTQLRPGKSYRVELRASGGLTIQPE